jgi:hypothetical protein
MALGQLLLRVLTFSPVCIIPRSHVSFRGRTMGPFSAQLKRHNLIESQKKVAKCFLLRHVCLKRGHVLKDEYNFNRSVIPVCCMCLLT